MIYDYSGIQFTHTRCRQISHRLINILLSTPNLNYLHVSESDEKRDENFKALKRSLGCVLDDIITIKNNEVILANGSRVRFCSIAHHKNALDHGGMQYSGYVFSEPDEYEEATYEYLMSRLRSNTQKPQVILHTYSENMQEDKESLFNFIYGTT